MDKIFAIARLLLFTGFAEDTTWNIQVLLLLQYRWQTLYLIIMSLQFIYFIQLPYCWNCWIWHFSTKISHLSTYFWETHYSETAIFKRINFHFHQNHINVHFAKSTPTFCHYFDNDQKLNVFQMVVLLLLGTLSVTGYYWHHKTLGPRTQNCYQEIVTWLTEPELVLAVWLWWLVSRLCHQEQ